MRVRKASIGNSEPWETLNSEPSGSITEYILKVLYAVPALEKPDLLIGALRDYLSGKFD